MTLPSSLASFPLLLLAFGSASPAGAAQLGTNYCTAAPNSTGAPALMGASGSVNININQLTLDCQRLPVGSAGYFLTSLARGFVANPAGSAGNLCLSQPVGRYVHSVLVAGPTGTVMLPIDLGSIPSPLGAFALAPGDTASFQYWHRDSGPQGPTSNFSDGLELEFSNRCELGSGFFPGARFRSYGSADLIEAADLNGDGIMDLVKNSDESNLLAVHFGDGNGRFPYFLPIDIGSESTGLAVGDMDGDGDMDLVSSNSTSGSVSVMLNIGGGAFAPHVEFPVGADLAGIDLGDLDGDGDLDVVVADAAWTANTVSLLRNDGGGTLGPWTTLSSTNSPRAIKLVDLDADGDEDLVVGNDSGTVAIWMNGGAGFAGTGQYTTATNRPSQLDVGDFNGDGRVDLAVANSQGLDLLVMLGAGDGTFSGSTVIPASAAIGHLDVSDVNGDGNLDLVGARSYNFGIDVFHGLGDGSFSPSTFVRTGRSCRSVVAVDLDGEPGVELAATVMNLGEIVVLTRNDDAGFHTQESYGVGRRPEDLVLGDVNGDGVDDFVVANYFDSTISVGIGMPDGTFQVGGALAVGVAPLDVELGDLDGDGDLDLATANYSGHSVTLLFNQGGGVFAGFQEIPTGTRTCQVALGDVDGDGDIDLVATNQGVAPARGLSVLLNDGSGSFQQPAPIYEQGATPGGLELLDLDQDGDLDVIFAVDEIPFTGFAIMANDGLGTFDTPLQIASTLRARGLASGDFDADGDVDIVVIEDFTFEMFEGLGGLVFAAPQAAPDHGTFLQDITVGDIDLDGILDVVTVGQVANVFLGRGDLTFGDRSRYALGLTPHDVALRDVDGDGLLDLLATEINQGGVTVLRNLCR